MKKRIFAFLTALLLVLTSLFMTACDKTSSSDGEGDGEGGSSIAEESKVNVDELTPKELFSHSITNSTVLSDKKSVQSLEEIVDFVGSSDDVIVKAKVELNKLNVQGQDVLGSDPVKLALEAALDVENEAAEVDLEADLFGEKPTLNAIVSKDGFYVTDILGVNDKAIAATFEELDIPVEDLTGQLDSILESTGLTEEDLAKIGDLGTFFVDTINKALDANITDAAYAVETKDVTIDGTEIKGAKVITITITPEIAKGFVSTVVTEALANDLIKKVITNASGSEITADQVMESIAPEIENAFKSVKIINTVDYDKTVALDMEITVGEDTFAVRSTAVGNSQKATAGLLKDGAFDTEGAIVTVEYTLDGSNEKYSVNVKDPYGDEQTIIYEGTVSGDKHEGTVTANIDGQKISVKGSFEGGLDNYKFIISEVSVEMDGASTTIPLDLAVEYGLSNNKLVFNFSLAIDIQDTASIDFAIETSVERTNATVNVPTDAISFSEIDENTLADWGEKLMNKFPKILEYVQNMMDATATPDYDIEYDPDYEYDYEDDYDFGYGTGTAIPDGQF